MKDMIDRYIVEHLPKLAKKNAGDQVSMQRKMREPAWGNKLVTKITKADVVRFRGGRPPPPDVLFAEHLSALGRAPPLSRM